MNLTSDLRALRERIRSGNGIEDSRKLLAFEVLDNILYNSTRGMIEHMIRSQTTAKVKVARARRSNDLVSRRSHELNPTCADTRTTSPDKHSLAIGIRVQSRKVQAQTVLLKQSRRRSRQTKRQHGSLSEAYMVRDPSRQRLRRCAEELEPAIAGLIRHRAGGHRGDPVAWLEVLDRGAHGYDFACDVDAQDEGVGLD